MTSLLAGSGQLLSDAISRRSTTASLDKQTEFTNQTFFQRMGILKWNPIQTLSDEKYADMVRERILMLDVEIDIIKEHIRASEGGKSAEDMRQDSFSTNGRKD